MSDPDTELSDFLTRYAATLARFDAAGAAELWATPAMIVDDRFAGVLSARADMIQGLEQSYPLYRRLGLSTVDFELLGQQWLSAAITQVHVRWLFYDGDGELLTDSNPYYLLRRDEDGLRACVCVQTDDLAKLQDLAARHGIDLPGPQ